jgi:GH43 family beta-xylosidase
MIHLLKKMVATTATALVIGLAVLAPLPVFASPAVFYNNTLIQQRADPHIVKHTDGFYYFTATVPAYDKIILRRAETIQGLGNAPETTIWTRKSSGVGSGQVWAPELHYIDGKWYIYVALGVSGQWRIRAFVLEGTGDNPLTAKWVEKGIIKTNWDTFSLDASTFVANGVRYLVWAQEDPTYPDDSSSLMLAPLQNPWTIKGTAVAISRPDLSWERVGYKVNEGPNVLQKNGKIFLTYSASATDANYCMGLLTASTTADLMKASSWVKTNTPIFVSNADTNQWGPGHNSFTVSEDGQSDILVYHDRGYRDIKGDPLNDPNRRTRVQKLYWKADGTPDFGVPVPEGVHPVRLRSYSNPVLFVRHNGSVSLQANAPNLVETQFRIASPGLAGAGTVSLEAVNKPGSYLRRSGMQLTLETDNKSAAFKGEASFKQRSGLADAQGVSFEASDSSGKFLRADGDSSLVVQDAADATQKGQATFYLE